MVNLEFVVPNRGAFLDCLNEACDTYQTDPQWLPSIIDKTTALLDEAELQDPRSAYYVKAEGEATWGAVRLTVRTVNGYSYHLTGGWGTAPTAAVEAATEPTPAIIPDDEPEEEPQPFVEPTDE